MPSWDFQQGRPIEVLFTEEDGLEPNTRYRLRLEEFASRRPLKYLPLNEKHTTWTSTQEFTTDEDGVASFLHQPSRNTLQVRLHRAQPVEPTMGEVVELRPAGPVSVPSPPPKSARKAEWVDYAQSQGMDIEDAEAMTKAELIEEFGEE